MTDFGPCSAWPAIFPCDITTQSPAVSGIAVTAATEIMYALTGRQFGACQVTLRPCRKTCNEYPWPNDWGMWPGREMWPQPVLMGGLWFNVICGGCSDNCSCGSLSEVKLPVPVQSIDVVKLDGSPMVTGAYRVDDNQLLVRIDGGTWPYCQDLNKADTQIGTWSVTATIGQPVPKLGSLAVGELACEIIRGINGEDCRLPKQVTQLARQGVTITFPNVTELLTEGRLGLYFPDLMVATYNPHHLGQRARTYSVDGPRPRRVGT